MSRIVYSSNNFNINHNNLYKHLIKKYPNSKLIKQLQKEEYEFGKPKKFIQNLINYYINKINKNGYYNSNWLKDSLIYYEPENEEEYELYYSKKNFQDLEKKSKFRLKKVCYNLYNRDIDKMNLKELKTRRKY